MIRRLDEAFERPPDESRAALLSHSLTSAVTSRNHAEWRGFESRAAHQVTSVLRGVARGMIRLDSCGTPSLSHPLASGGARRKARVDAAARFFGFPS